jgi:transposase InsO family protein
MPEQLLDVAQAARLSPIRRRPPTLEERALGGLNQFLREALEMLGARFRSPRANLDHAIRPCQNLRLLSSDRGLRPHQEKDADDPMAPTAIGRSTAGPGLGARARPNKGASTANVPTDLAPSAATAPKAAEATLDAVPEGFAERLFLRSLRSAPLDRFALRALLKAQYLLGLALGQVLARMREAPEPLEAACAQVQAASLLNQLLREALDLLGGRFDKLPERRRPHYTPAQRFRILQLRHLAALNRDDTARLFRVSATTVARWEVEANPVSQTVGSTVTPTPPVRRYNDTVQHLVQTLARLGFGGYAKISQHLARDGWKVAKTSVRRYLRQPRQTGPPAPETKPRRPLTSRSPHHVWHLDLTLVEGFLRGAALSLATLLDSHSRMPLLWRLYESPPTAEQMVALVEDGFQACGRPRHLVVDKAGEFRATHFRERLDAWRVRLRYDSAQNHRANARLERFWLSLKTLLRLTPLPAEPGLSCGDIERDIERAMLYYAYLRPHDSLGGASPAEVYFALPPAHLDAVQPPRGRRGDPPVPAPAGVEFLDGDPRFPFLRKAA